MNLTIIQKSIDYIEDNLKTDITAKELSEMAGFSMFHYYRLFHSAVGLPVMQYITRRRLLNALYDIHCGEKMVVVALDYGFETQAGFYKAFIREFGYTPTEFLNMSKKKKPYRINLFKEEHIMVSHKKLKEVLQNWGLENEKLSDVVYAETGNVSESACYVGDNYIIKFSPNLGNVEKHISLSQAIESVGLSTATPIKTVDGKFVVASEELYFYVTKRLEGKQLKASTMYFEDYMPKARFIGEIVGQLSVALSKVEVITNQANIFKSAKEWAIPALSGKMDFPKSFVEMYEKEFGEIYESLPQQIIHRDPNPGNIILYGDNWGVLDFDLSERNIRIFDPCYAATAILSESFEADNADKLKQWIMIYKNILYGYDEVVKLSDNEWKAIPYVVITNQLISTAWFSEQEKYRELYETNKKMTEWMLHNFD
ncbi:MAG: helix-turn-helix domain-containing protein, partial [Lachnospiraceae bacterium]|nr:helix-turn-helix domain-containing protein [Lachnospiraceae bacterium]